MGYRLRSQTPAVGAYWGFGAANAEKMLVKRGVAGTELSEEG